MRTHARTSWRELLVTLACVCFVFQQALVPLHLALHPHTSHVHGPAFDAAEQAHDHGHRHPGHDEDDHAPHSEDDHCTVAGIAIARLSVQRGPVAALPTTVELPPLDVRPQAFVSSDSTRFRPPPLPGAHRPRAPPATV